MDKEILDINEFLDRVMDDKELVSELLDDFSHVYSEKLKQLKRAVKQRDFEKIHEIAHSIKGAAGNISAKSMYTCYNIIEHLSDYKELDLILELLKDLEDQFSELKIYIKKLKRGRQLKDS